MRVRAIKGRQATASRVASPHGSRGCGRSLQAATITGLVLLASLSIFPYTGRAMAWIVDIVDPDSPLVVGSLVLDASGTPNIVYYNWATNTIKQADYSGLPWTIDMVSNSTTVHEVDIALDGSGRPYLAWSDLASTLWYAWRNGTTWDRELVTPTLGDGWVKLALDAQDRPHIVFDDGPMGSRELWHGVRENATWAFDMIDSGTDFAISGRLIVDGSGFCHASYVEESSPNHLKHARQNASSWNVDTVYTAPNLDPGGLAVDSEGRPHLSFLELTDGDLLYTAWNGTGWSIQTVDSVTRVGWESSLFLDVADRPHISYWGPDARDLKYARWNGSAWINETVDSAGDVGRFSSLAVDQFGTVHILYQDTTNAQVKYARGTPDNPYPGSLLNPITPYWQTASPLTITANAWDPLGLVKRVDLLSRFDGGGGWEPWGVFGIDLAPSWTWSFPWPQGEGRYEFYSLAFDGRDWELKGPGAEASAGYDVTPPASSVNPVAPYWRDSSPLPLTATAADALSGVAQVTLLWRYAPDNLTWTGWTPFAADSSPPWSWMFPFTAGDGNYEFHALAADVAGNAEGAKATWEARAGYRAPLQPPQRVTTVWDGGTGIGLVWEQPGGIAPDVYLVYRAGDPTGFADLSPATAHATVNAPATAWADPEPLLPPEERYYVMRAVYSNGTEVSATSNTAGVFAGTLNAGLTAISRPLEYFPWVDYSGAELDTVGEYRTAFAASRIEYLDAGTWQRVFGGGDPNTVLEVGRAYVVARANPGRFVFTGLPGAQLLYADAPGFDPAIDARELQLTVAGDDVLLTFTQPPGVVPGVDAYEVRVATSRAGFFDGSAVLVSGSPVLAGPGPTMSLTDAGAILRSPELYYMVIPVTAAGVGASTYSVGVFTRTFQGADTLALPLRPSSPSTVDAYADMIPGTLGILYLSGGVWVPHFRGMPAGAYDAAVNIGAGYQISTAAGSRYSFVGS